MDQTDWLAEGAPFDLRLLVGEGVSAEDSIVVDLYSPVTSRSQFTATLDDRLLGTRRTQVTIPLVELPAQSGGTRRIRLVPDATEVAGERSIGSLGRLGVYPLVVGVRPAGTGAEPAEPIRTYIVRTPADRTTPLQVAVVQPAGAPLAHQPDGSVALSEGALDELATLAEVLASSAGTPLTVAPRPETLEAVAQVAGDAVDPRAGEATAVLDDLRAGVAERQVASMPYVDVALDALETAGLGEDVGAQRRRGDAVLDEVLGVRTDARTWLADGGFDGRSLRRLAGLGVDRVVLPDEVLSPVELRLSLARPFTITPEGAGPPLAASAPEPALSARYGSNDPVLAAQHVLADLAVLHGDEPVALRARGVVLAPPTDATTIDAHFLRALLDGLATSPVLTPVTLATYFDEVDVQLVEDEQLVRTVSPGGEQLAISEAEVSAARSRLTGYSTMVTGQAEELEALADLTLLAEADGLDVGVRRSYLAGVGTGIDAGVGSVGVVDAGSFRLADSVGTIPLTLVQDGDDRLLVRVTLESEQLAFGPERQVGRYAYDVELTSENTPLVVPVLVRSPGTFPLLVTISSPDERLQVARTQVTIHSTAFSGVGVALSAGAGFFLLLWWGRHWRTVRRAKRLVPVP